MDLRSSSPLAQNRQPRRSGSGTPLYPVALIPETRKPSARWCGRLPGSTRALPNHSKPVDPHHLAVMEFNPMLLQVVHRPGAASQLHCSYKDPRYPPPAANSHRTSATYSSGSCQTPSASIPAVAQKLPIPEPTNGRTAPERPVGAVLPKRECKDGAYCFRLPLNHIAWGVLPSAFCQSAVPSTVLPRIVPFQTILPSFELIVSALKVNAPPSLLVV